MTKYREIRIKQRVTKDGPFVYVSLYDDQGRFSCTARFGTFTEAVAEAIDSYLSTGRLTTFAQFVVRHSKDWAA